MTISRIRESEDGLGLIEIVVSMFLLALTALALLPLLIQGVQASAKNSTTASATQLVSQQVEQARQAATTCQSLRTFGLAAVASVTDPRGVVLQPVRTVGTCPASYPGTVTFTASVTSDGDTLATATTRILVTSAG